MNTHVMNSHQLLAECHFDLGLVDPSWLAPLGVKNEADFTLIRSNHRSHRTLTLMFLEHYRLRSEYSDETAGRYRWVWRDRAFLKALASRLGLIANAEFVRTSIARRAVLELHRTLGEAACREALELSTAPDFMQVGGITRSQFDAAIDSGAIKMFLLAVGNELLDMALMGAGEVIRQRVRFAFPANGYQTSLQLAVEPDSLAGAIGRLAEEL